MSEHAAVQLVCFLSSVVTSLVWYLLTRKHRWENEKLRTAIRHYGLTIMRTSGDWSLHSTGEEEERQRAAEDAIIEENAELREAWKKLHEQKQAGLILQVYQADAIDGFGRTR